MASTFDIGPSGDLAIFTNNAQDIFNTDGDLGPNFLLEQGPDRGIAEIGQTENLVGGVTVDIPNEAPIDFGRIVGGGKKPSSKTATRVEKMESNASDATVEAEPVKKRPSKTGKVVKPSRVKSVSSDYSEDSGELPPFPKVSRESSAEPTTDIPSFGFDDLLDNRKLKPVSESQNISAEIASLSGESQSTIRAPEQEEYSPPPSPGGSEPAASPAPRPRREREVRREPAEEVQAQEPSKYINEEDEKRDLLLKLQALERRKGIQISKKYTLKSDIEEIRMEYRAQNSRLEAEASIKFMRKGLIFCTSGIEYMNRRFDPVGAKLDGWGENVMENVMDFDGIFERLHDKYSGSVEMEPEMELMFALGGSAFMFHLSNTLFKNASPQFGQVLRENPDVLNGILGVAKEAARRNNNNGPMASNDMGNVGGGGMGVGTMPSPGLDIGAMLGAMGINGAQGMSGLGQHMANAPPDPMATREFKEPPVNDLYRQMVEKAQQQGQNQADPKWGSGHYTNPNQYYDDNLSVGSAESTRSIGQGPRGATISPLPPSKRGGGGNVIKL